MNDFAAQSPTSEEQERWQKARDSHLAFFRELKDTNGVSAEMVDHAVAIFAEGFATGQTDIRALLYCVIRDTLKETK